MSSPALTNAPSGLIKTIVDYPLTWLITLAALTASTTPRSATVTRNLPDLTGMKRESSGGTM